MAVGNPGEKMADNSKPSIVVFAIFCVYGMVLVIPVTFLAALVSKDDFFSTLYDLFHLE